NYVIAENPVQQQADALPPAATFQVTNILKGVLTHGTARSSLASGLALTNFAGKTGTTNDGMDAWFVGFSPSMLVLTWVGFDGQEKMGLTGAAAALPLWTEFIRGANPFLTDDDFAKPDGLDAYDICRACKGIATSACPEIQIEYFVPGTQPKDQCPPT